MPNKHNRKVCSDKCKNARDLEFEKRRRAARASYGNCRYCNTLFRKRNDKHSVCSNPECREKKKADRRKNKGIEPEELLGPDAPMMPMRKCHDCEEMTYNYRCDKCKAKWRAKNGACGLSGVGDLFTGHYLSQQSGASHYVS